MNLSERYFRIRDEAIAISGNPNLCLIAVSKRHPYSSLRDAFMGGVLDFGENQISEGLGKIQEWKAEFPERNIYFHHIGPVQTGSLRKLFGNFQFTHGVGSLNTLKELKKRSDKEVSSLKYFLQVNLTLEDSKNGILEEEVTQILGSIQDYSSDRLIFAGLMTMGPTDEDPIKTREVFKKLRLIRDDLCPGKSLSMGMSGDYKIALEEGSDIIRIGTAIFGERNYG
ncbi:YggS family pyridoxal phosphate-dependent enzyme [Leptospira sp. GIMC2001]|uniref:YggS family pyridoxal phosphate-dependent enzyme n=1 Tax=Leptospira sp. GIMC2001 TaxID=1513297 RepID=UPI00234B4B9F|nr:YggS family pyridoxal phosphate-dependent enzyme [Leptospira sp. GIMC2001]WCL48152.1 YggS family pyridoxal phosphate-dependent enzyme [Leptospira sp. GIMC2001]